MKYPSLIANAILWAAAIATSAIVGAPAFLSTVLLPLLATISLLLQRRLIGHRAECARS